MTNAINLDELRNLVQNYPVWPGSTLSHGTMRRLCALGLAVRDASGCWIPTAAGVRRYLEATETPIERQGP